MPFRTNDSFLFVYPGSDIRRMEIVCCMVYGRWNAFNFYFLFTRSAFDAKQSSKIISCGWNVMEWLIMHSNTLAYSRLELLSRDLQTKCEKYLVNLWRPSGYIRGCVYSHSKAKQKNILRRKLFTLFDFIFR